MPGWVLPFSDLTPEQQDIVQLPANQHRIVTGPPGSGKTQVMLHRARHLSEEFGNTQGYQVFLYTKVLKSYIQSGLQDLNLPPDRVTTLDSWCYQKHIQEIGAVPQMGGKPNFPVLRSNVLEYLSKSYIQRYKFVVVDEGQDLSKTSYEILDKIAEHITVFADEQQQIYDDGATSSGIYESLGISHSSRAFLQAYRNSSTVAKLASYFIDHDDRRHQYLAMQHDRTLGRDTPLLYVAPHFEAEMDRLARIIEQRVLQNQKVGVIMLQNRLAHGYAQGLEERGVKVEVLDQGFGNDRKYDFQNNVPKIVSIYNCKGLTFDVVLMPHLRNGAFPRHADTFMRRRLLFVAISRAMEWVYLSKSEEDRLDEESVLKSATSEGALILQDSQDAAIDSASSPSDINMPF